ncbi:MAG: rhomboid family intramembrane serine protease, partial [Chloroflexota bacterium]
MLPLRDVNPSRRVPVVTITFIAINILVFLYQQTLSEEEQYALALVPFQVTHRFNLDVALTFFSSMFMHANLLHIGGNMLYLWIFGDNVEDAMGHVRYILFYLLSGVAAALSQILVTPNTRIPMIGASGAIAGVLGGYLLLYPNARILSMVIMFYFIRLVEVPAYILLGLWFILQFFTGFASFGTAGETGGVAVFAHIGGFVFGLLTVKLFTLG